MITGNWGQDFALLLKAAADAGLQADWYTYYAGGAGGPTAIKQTGLSHRVFAISEGVPNSAPEAAQKWEADFRAKLGVSLFYPRAVNEMRMLAKAVEQAKTDEPKALATQFEGMKSEAFDGGDIWMRKDDHQLFQDMYIAASARSTPAPSSTRREPAGAGRASASSKRATRFCRPPARWTVREGRAQLFSPRALARAVRALAMRTAKQSQTEPRWDGCGPSRGSLSASARDEAELVSEVSRGRAKMLQLIAFSTLNGVLYGMLLFMMASGLTLIFSMMGVLNFAHASFYMLGAYFGFEISRHIGFWPGFFVAPLLVGALGALVERFGLRRVHRLGHVSELLFTFGLAFVIEEVVQMVWGKLPVDYRVPPSLDFVAFRLFDTTYPAYRMFMLLTAIAMFAALFAVLTRTRVGLVIQAALTHPEAVAMLGHNVPGLFMLVFGAGAALAGLAGVIAGPALVTQPGMADLLGPILFVVIVVGGLGSLTGALVASLLIGIVQTFAVAMNASLAEILGPDAPPLLGDLWQVTIAQLAPVIPYLLLVLVLIFRPTGLMGTRES